MAAAAAAAPPATPAGGSGSGRERTSTPGLAAALSLAICTATRARAGYDGTRNAGVIAIGVRRALHARVGLLDAAPDAPNACEAGMIAAFAAACACGRRAWRHGSCWGAGGGTDWTFLKTSRVPDQSRLPAPRAGERGGPRRCRRRSRPAATTRPPPAGKEEGAGEGEGKEGDETCEALFWGKRGVGVAG